MAESAETYYAQAIEAFRRADWGHAAAFAGQAVAAEPGLAAPHYVLGAALLEGGNWAPAQGAFEACLARAPAYPLSHHCSLNLALTRARSALQRGAKPVTARISAQLRPFVSCIVCSITPSKFEKIGNRLKYLLAELPHEIVGIHDARSLSEGYNRGARASRGDVLLFCHDDIDLASSDFAARLLAHMQVFELVGIVGGTRLAAGTWVYEDWPHIHGQVSMAGASPDELVVTAFNMEGAVTPNAKVLDGVLMATRRALWERQPFDESTFDGWHLYDFDFSLRAHRAGAVVGIAHDLLVVHESQGNFGADWKRYCARFNAKHGEALALKQDGTRPELCTITVRSAAEWMLLTQFLTRAEIG